MDIYDIETKKEARITQLHHRLQVISDIEARAVLVNGYGANGELDGLRTRILRELDTLCE